MLRARVRITLCVSFLGRVVISGGKDGLIAVSSPTTGMIVRMLNDHKGAPITDIHVSSHKVRSFFTASDNSPVATISEIAMRPPECKTR